MLVYIGSPTDEPTWVQSPEVVRLYEKTTLGVYFHQNQSNGLSFETTRIFIPLRETRIYKVEFKVERTQQVKTRYRVKNGKDII